MSIAASAAGESPIGDQEGLSKAAAKGHAAGEPFVLVQPNSLRMIRLPAWAKDREAVVRAHMPNREEAAASTIVREMPSAPVRASRIEVDGEQVVGAREPAIAIPTGGSTVDLEAREALQRLLGAMGRHGLIES